MKWLGWLGWSIDHTVPSSLLVAWIIHSSVVRRDLFQETFFWKPTSYVDAYRKEKGPLTVFFWKQIVHQKIPALQIAFFPPPQPVQNPGWNWSFPPGVRSNLVACRNRPSRTSWAAVVAPWRNQCPWRHQCPAEVGILERKFFGQPKGGYIDFGGSRSWIFYRLLQLSENQRLCYSRNLVKSAECVGIWNLPIFGDRSFIFGGVKICWYLIWIPSSRNSEFTTLKINMEHNHGALEDQFPF